MDVPEEMENQSLVRRLRRKLEKTPPRFFGGAGGLVSADDTAFLCL